MGAGDRRLVPDVVVDEVALAAAFVAFPADEALIFEERDRLGDGRRADLKVLDEFGRGEAVRVGGKEAGQHQSRHLGQALLHQEGGEGLLVLAYGLVVAPVALRRCPALGAGCACAGGRGVRWRGGPGRRGRRWGRRCASPHA